MPRALTRALAAAVGALALAYAALFVLQAGDLVYVNAFNPDTVIGWVLTQTPHPGGHRDVVDSSYGFYSVLWFDALTEGLPRHRAVWEAQPYVQSLLAALLVALAVLRAAGRRPALLCFVLLACASTGLLAVELKPTWHGPTFFAATVLALVAVELAVDEPFGGPRRRVAACALAAAIVGIHLVDALLWVVGVAPFVVALGGWHALARTARSRRGLMAGGAVLGGAIVVWRVSVAAMAAAGYRQFVPDTVSLIHSYRDVGPHLKLLAELMAYMGAGAWVWPGSVRELLSLGAAIATTAAVALPLLLLARRLRRGEPRRPMLVHLLFWAAAVVVLSTAMVVSNLGVDLGSVRYTVALFFAAAAALPLLLGAGRGWSATALAGAVVIVAAAVVQLADRDVAERAAPVRAQLAAIGRAADDLGAHRGVGSYDLASNVTWLTRGAVVSRPVENWTTPERLCEFPVGRDAAWYRPTGAPRTFLLWPGNVELPPPGLGAPIARRAVGGATMFVFRGDVSRRLCPTASAR